jgi:class 3 adenylate cyclase
MAESEHNTAMQESNQETLPENDTGDGSDNDGEKWLDKETGDTSTTNEAGEDDESVTNRDDEDDEEEDEDGSDYDSDEERDDFSVSLVADDTSFLSADASSVATEDRSFTTTYSNSTDQQSVIDGDSQRVAKGEDTAVKCGRYMMYFMLVALGVVLAYSLFRVVRDRELEDFNTMFYTWSEDLGTAWQDNLAEAFIALDALSVDMTTAVPSSSWPLVTVSNYAVFSAVARGASASLSATTLAPIVTLQERADYENYTSTRTDWVSDSIEWKIYNETENENPSGGSGRRNLQQADFSGVVSTKIYRIENGQAVVDDSEGPYYPIRHIDPVDETSINYNLFSNDYMEFPVSESYFKEAAILGLPLEEPPDANVLREICSQGLNSDYLAPMAFPVFDKLGADRTAVGVLPALFSWNSLFSDVLPADVTGVVAVVENDCNEGFSMEIDGKEVTYLGPGDRHDPEFESSGQIFTLRDLDLLEATVSRVPFNDIASCGFQVTFYPSEETVAAFSSNAPKSYATAAAVTFFIALLVVCIYDCVQERRNQSVLKAAMEARAIVSSLFPAVVRDRLFETNRQEQALKKKKNKRRLRRKKKDKKKKNDDNNDDSLDANPGEGLPIPGILDVSKGDMEMAPTAGTVDARAVQRIVDSIQSPRVDDDRSSGSNKKSGVSHPKHRLKNYLSTPTSAYGFNDKSDEFGFGLGKPIADLFPHTTVLFADIVGFTAWSSEREPEQVFTLLQTVYHAFDRLAKRRGVFKVETIGDCYVAVTGLPDPQPDHAVRIAKFSRECMIKMTELTKKLEVSLGPGTGDLCMRLGLHSGPVTAGVLMGEKSRFQLFGDTVNTASRMESTGEKNRIQVSKSTADLLIEAGKSYWVKPREDLVHAKGKGQVQTFWVVAGRSGGLHANHSSDGGDLMAGRRAPPRTQSALSDGEPVRGIKRTTSESIKRSSEKAISQGSALNDRREDRLIQWQVELFVRLLKKIVACRALKMDTSARRKIDASAHRKIDASACSIGEEGKADDFENLDNDESHEVWTEELSVASESVAPPADRFAEPGRPTLSGRERVPSFRKPTRQLSLDTLKTSNHSMLRSSVHSGSLDADASFASVEPNTVDDEFGTTVFDEVAEIITLPNFSPEAIKALEHSDEVDLGEVVMSQLHDYICTIAQLYRENPFHNFEHASHVTMSANKLLNRIVIPENVDYERESNAIASDLHDYTYGITSDPLTQFAVVFSALVHDADHTGVPNAQLAKENPDMADLYRDQSIAEQNSVDLAWDLFMDPRYKDLQECVAATRKESLRFRQLVVNSVMATDIFDKDMKELRDKRWDKAFHRGSDENRVISESSIEEDRNMKATIVIEHIIQASDVAHTMQHWHIYQKWNERLFEEMFSAFECGRSEKNPADFWYKGELWFFDNYVVPLAKKLEECNVFGVASDECLNYAEANRNEWSVKGEEAVQQMVERYHKRKFFVAGIAKKRAPSARRLATRQKSG